MNIAGIIPARYASTRFPGKPLIDISGKSMIRRVYEQAVKASALKEVWVATDDQRIFDHVSGFGGRAMMTSPLHASGTERCFEVLDKLEQQKKNFDVVINIQGDEPFIDPSQIDKVADCFHQQEIEIATLIKSIGAEDELFNPNIIKVVTGVTGMAIYFSRAVIPYCRSAEIKNWLSVFTFYKHIGIYAYRSRVLKKLIRLMPAPLESAESLEQLRWIENGYKIHTEITDMESHSIDTPDDLKKMHIG